jgi:hypothetical protein
LGKAYFDIAKLDIVEHALHGGELVARELYLVEAMDLDVER